MATSVARRSPDQPYYIFHYNSSTPETDDPEGTPPNNSRSTKPPVTQATRGWKVVDAKTIFNRRKYVRRASKRLNATGGATVISTKAANSQTHPASKCKTPATPTSPLKTVAAPQRISWPSPESDIRSGGLRGDPFNAFPIENHQAVPSALDYLLKQIGAVACPGAIRRNSYSPKISEFMKIGLDHDLVFHALIAFAQAYSEVANTGATEPSPAVLYHRGKATQGLYARLKDSKTCADDASILTTFLLIDNVWRFGEAAIGHAHYAGLTKMVEMRGGVDNLGMNGVLKSIIEFAQVTDIGDSMGRTNSPQLPGLRYFHHPFPPELCAMVARLPDGYTEIAMQGQLSLETITVLDSLREWLQSDPDHRPAAPSKQIGAARRCLSASSARDGSNVEETVCFGIIVTGMRMFHARFSRMDHTILDRIVELGEALDVTHRTAEREHVAYLTMVAVEASDLCIELQSHVRRLVDLLVEREKFATTWEGMEKVLKKFFWADFVAPKWRACWNKHLRRRSESRAKLPE